MRISMIAVIIPESVQGTPRNASSSTMCNFLHHGSHHSIAHNLIFSPFALSPTVLNFLSSLQHMGSTISEVMNRYSQKNQETHLERSAVFRKEANLYGPFNGCHQIVCFLAAYCRWQWSVISSMPLHEYTDQVISKVQSESTGQSTLSSDTDKYDFNHQQEVYHRGQVRHDRSLRTTRVPLRQKWYNADTVISHIVLPNSSNPASYMAPPALHHERSTLLTNYSKLTVLYRCWHCHCPSYVKTRMFHNPRPVEIRMLLTTKKLPLR